MDTTTGRGEGQQAVLVLAPFRSHIEIIHYPASRTLRADCGHWAWLSPKGEKYLGACRTMCLDCADMDSADAHQLIAPKGTLDYIRQVAGENGAAAAEQMIRQLGVAEDDS